MKLSFATVHISQFLESGHGNSATTPAGCRSGAWGTAMGSGGWLSISSESQQLGAWNQPDSSSQQVDCQGVIGLQLN